MLKKRFECFMSLVLVTSVALLATECKGLTVLGSDMSISNNDAIQIVSSNGIRNVSELFIVSDEDGNVLSVDGSERDIPSHGHNGARDLVKEQQTAYPDCTTFTIPESDTWSFEQTFARGELFAEFQKARMDKNNWKYYTNDEGQPLAEKYVTVTKEYVWDYNLEQAAMQRAIEQAYTYGHTRPDMVTSYEVYQDLDSPYWYAANVNELTSAYGTSAKEIVDIYMEGDETCYAKQTHRVAILTDSYYRIGIGCVKTKGGKYYTAIEIAEDKDENGNIIPLGAYTEPVDGYKEMTIKSTTSGDKPSIARMGLCSRILSGKSKELEIGQTFDIRTEDFGPEVNGIATVKGNSPYFENWYSEDESIAVIKDGVITAVGEGNVNIMAKGKYMRAIVGITVKAPPKPEPTPEPTPEPIPTPQPQPQPTPEPTPPSSDVTVEPQPAPQPQTPVLKEQKIDVAKKFRKTLTIKKSTLKKKQKTYKLGVKVNDGGMHGVVTYKVTKYPKKGKKYISVSSKGKVTLKKGAKKGTYKIKITAAKAGGFKETSRTVTIKVK